MVHALRPTADPIIRARAALRPLEGGVRAVGIEARRVSAGDLLLALRLGEGDIETDLPLSASVRAEFAPDGTLQAARGQLIADAGFIQDPGGGVVVGGEHREALAGGFPRSKIVDCYRHGSRLLLGRVHGSPQLLALPQTSE